MSCACLFQVRRSFRAILLVGAIATVTTAAAEWLLPRLDETQLLRSGNGFAMFAASQTLGSLSLLALATLAIGNSPAAKPKPRWWPVALSFGLAVSLSAIPDSGELDYINQSRAWGFGSWTVGVFRAGRHGPPSTQSCLQSHLPCFVYPIYVRRNLFKLRLASALMEGSADFRCSRPAYRLANSQTLVEGLVQNDSLRAKNRWARRANMQPFGALNAEELPATLRFFPR